MERALRNRLPGGEFEGVSRVHSRRMAAIRGSGNRTTEARFRAMLVRAAIRGWTVKPTTLPGRPDFYFGQLRIAVFLDGCFWHGCPRCGHVPEVNRPYWSAKIQRNRRRDREQDSRLRAEGVRVLRLWEHELRDAPATCLERLSSILREKHAVERVLRAGVHAPESAVLDFVRSIGPKSILSAKLCAIRDVARAF